MTEKQICCCKSQVWTEVIAWLQMIGAVLLFIILGLTIAQPLAEIAKIHNLNNPYGERDVTLTHEDIETRKTAFSPIFVITVIVITVLRICLAFESFLMGIVLLGGSLYRNTRVIRGWMVYTIIATILSTIMAIIETSIGAGDKLVLIIGIVLVITIQGFFLWVVGTHKNEIEPRG